MLGCEKESPPTTIKGRVIDNNTGQPVIDAEIYFSDSDSEFNGKPVYEDKFLETDSKGEFTLSFHILGTGPHIDKDGYLPKDLGNYIGFSNQDKYKLTSGITNEIGDVMLYPKDGTFKVIFNNVTGTQNEVFSYFNSYLSRQETTPGSLMPISTQPKIINKGEISIEVCKINANDWVKILWSHKYSTFDNTDSFYVNKTDTAVYNITF